MLFQIGALWWPLLYYGVGLGVFAVARGVGRHTRWLHLTALLQVANIINCDPINPMLGILTLILLRTRPVREYLAAERAVETGLRN
jgi:hypothetical protein